MFKLATVALSLIAVGLAIAALVHTAGWHVNPGAVSAAGSFTAAIAALTIATWGWIERKHDRDRSDHAQARLVVVEITIIPRSSIIVTVKNYGNRSILDITHERVEVGNDPSAQFAPQQQVLNVIAPNHDNANGGIFTVSAINPLAHAFLQDVGTLQPGDDGRPSMSFEIPLSATVRFTDANDNRWETTFALDREQTHRADGSTVTVRPMRRVSLKRV